MPLTLAESRARLDNSSHADALSCKTRGFCPSCLAKRAALWSEWLLDEVLLPVRHHQWVFILPKRIRPFFLYDRSLPGDLARCAFRTVQQLSRRRAAELGLDAEGLPSASSASNTAAPASPAPTPDAAPIHAPAP